MKRFFFLFLSYFCLTVSYAQTVNHEFHDVSLSDALLTLDNDCDTITVNFIYNELEDFKVTADIRNASVMQAVRQVCGYYPMRITQLNTDIFVECTQKDSVRFIGQVLDTKRHPVRFATVVLLSADRDTLNYGLTNADGYFVIPCPQRQAFVKVAHLTYNTYEKFYKHDDVGTIMLTEANVKLPSTDVTAEKPDDPALHRSYHSLWRQVYKHSVADLPRSQLEVLNSIKTKARLENYYGMMMTAELMRASIVRELEPDSLPGIVQEMMEEEKKAETRNPLLATAYQVVLLNIPPVKGIDASQFEQYREKVMENVDLLSANNAEVFSPLVTRGDDSKIFGNDILSVVGMQTGNYQLLHDYYSKAGNRKAEMLTALWMLDKDYNDTHGGIILDKYNHYLSQLDSLCTQYGDLPECGEIALVRYKTMCEKKDITVQEKVQYIDAALQQWGKWKNANALRNERAELSEPIMNVELGEDRLLPDSSRVIYFHKVRNVKDVTLKISRLNVSQATYYGNLHGQLNAYQYGRLKEAAEPVEVATYRKKLNNPNEFDFVEDSLFMPGLPAGQYLAEFYSEECAFDTLRYKLAVSDVFLLVEPLPKKMARVVVVSGSTGQPLPGAKVIVAKRRRHDMAYPAYTADEKGELVLSTKHVDGFYPSVKGDDFAPETSYDSYNPFSYTIKGKEKIFNVYTDRAIYRPGQTVHVAMVAFKNKDNKEISSLNKKQLDLHVIDPNYSHVMDTTLVTDEYGTASFSFDIPTDRVNGNYRISVYSGRRCYSSETIKVEEYKIPTFSVELATMAKAEIVGDTILLPGYAKAFSGAQVTQAQVRYTVEQKRGIMRSYLNGTEVFTDTIQTDADGGFKVKIPIVVPKVEDTEDQWSFRVKAVVTDMGGESHEVEQTITMKDKERFFNISLPETKVEIGKPIFASFQVKNRWEEPVDTLVTYYVDKPVNKQTAKTNTSIQLAEFEALRQSGVHTLYAVCEGDTTKTQFYVVNYDDVRPGTYTRECFAQSATRFPDDGGEVRIQLGTSMKDVYVVYDVFADDKHLEGGAFTLSDQMYNRKLVYQPEYGAGVCLTFAFVKDGIIYTEKAVIDAPEKDHSLQMKWETFRDHLTPGQKEEWTLNITHPDGTPAKAQMLSVLYDAALDKIKEHDWWSKSQMLGFRASSTRWCYEKRSSLSGRMITKVKVRKAVKPLDFSHFNYDLLAMRANEMTVAEIAKVSKVMSKGKRGKGKRGYLMGMVVDEVGEPIIGASIRLGQSNRGAVTNIDGEFELENADDAYVTVSYVGYNSKTVWIAKGRYEVIELDEDYSCLQEVVVVGYGVQKKKNVTGSVSGVKVNAAPVRIRGAASNVRGMEPLYVVDGVIVDDISAYSDKIASISILKDASATAIYGAKASNGVVIISTKGTPITNALQEIEKQMTASPSTPLPVRENMVETAFFYPSLLSSNDGQMKLQFTLPESVTTWRFLGLAHDQDMNMGTMDCTVIAQKEVMVQPNVSRFVRKGDHATIVARISNITETPRQGVAEMILTDAETGKVVYSEKQNFNVDGNATTSVPFNFKPDDNSDMLICRTIVSGDNFSDGEQRYLPVLPDRELTFDTYVLTQHSPGRTVIDVDSMMMGSSYNSRKLMVEYTENPSWMMVLAMPTYTARPKDNAISQAVALYTNVVGGSIMVASATMIQTLRQWSGDESSQNPLHSELEKNEDMRDMLLSETPWMLSAQSEASMRRNLLKFFDQETMRMRVNNAKTRLKALQCSDGGWAWWKGMHSSEYATLAVMEILARMNANLSSSLSLSGSKYEIEQMMKMGMQYLDNIVVEQVFEMKEKEKDLVAENKKPRSTRNATILIPEEELLHYLYISSLFDNHPGSEVQDARRYLMNYVKGKNLDLTIYGKAVFAVIMAKDGQKEKAREYLKSLKEYAVKSPDKGMYFDTPKAYYSWCDYRIPTVTMAIEAIQLVEPEDKESVELMRRWLLSQKRVQQWDSEINAVDAIQAFFGDNQKEMDERLETGRPATISLGGKTLNDETSIPGLGYVKVVVSDSVSGKLCFDKKTTGTSWASVATQSMRRVSDIGDASTGMTVKREILSDNATLKVGDKVRVRITIEAEQDYDFVQITDKRAACMEPVNILSGYRNGYYQVLRDNVSQYFFSRLRKGTTTLETEYYIDRAGQYETGTCTAQCAYSPAFSARTGSITIKVE